MRSRRSSFAEPILVLIGLGVYLAGGPARADALSDLNKAFRNAYSQAASQSLADLRGRVPVLVNRFGEIALHRPGIEKPDFFSMDMKLYLVSRTVAHTAVAMNARLAPFSSKPLDADALEWLATYQALLTSAADELTNRNDIPEGIKTIQLNMLRMVLSFAQRFHQRGQVDPATLEEMNSRLRPAIKSNLEAAAASQLEQFKKQIAQWKVSFPGLAWDQAVVVIIGTHQARENYLQRQFFDWLLHDQPSKEERVVFAETLAPTASLETDPATDSLMLLAKVMLDKTLSTPIFGDPLALQSDVLGGAAAQIIRGWPRLDWCSAD
jgi:hypothetical protein